MTEEDFWGRTPPQRGGKSFHQAELAAAVLKRGGRIAIATKDGIKEIVGVPGFDDGRQIEGPSDA